MPVPDKLQQKKKWGYIPGKNVRNHISKWEAEDFAEQNAKFGGDAVGAKAKELIGILGEDIGKRLTTKELDGLLATYYNLSPDSFKKVILPAVKEYAMDPTIQNSNKLYDTMMNRYKIAPVKYQKGIKRRAAADTGLMGIQKSEPLVFEQTTDGGKILTVDPSVYGLDNPKFQSTWKQESPVKTTYPLNNTAPESISSWSGADAPNATPRLKGFSEVRQEDLNRGVNVFGDPLSPFSLRLSLPKLTDLLQLNTPQKQADRYFADVLGVSDIQPEMPSLFPRFKCGKLPRYEDGKPADATWHENWLKGRQKQFNENLESADPFDKTFTYPDYNTNTIEGQINNLKNSMVYMDPKQMDKVMGVQPGSTEALGEYNGFTHQNSTTPKGGSNIYISPKGGRVNTSIKGPKVYFDPHGVFIHEGTHALVKPTMGASEPIEARSPQESKIEQINKEAGKSLYSDRYNPNEQIVSGDYFDRPTETYAELMRSREELGLTPDRIVTPKEIEVWRKTGKLPYGLARYTDDVLLRYYNEVASNPNPLFNPDNIHTAFGDYKGGMLYAADGKSPIHIKPANRGKLTRLKKRTGKSEAELYRTGSAATRKMITFARNARKWKH